MKQEFYSKLGDELYKMKNSPFFKIGQKPIAKNESKVFGQSSQLSYDPDRLFNPDKREEKQQFLHPEIIEEQRRERQELDRIQYDLLKKNTDEQYKKLVKKMQSMRRFDHKHPYSWFGVYRGACIDCQTCGEYEGCFSQGLRQQGLQIMQCCKCRCPMNSHISVPEDNPFYDQIWKHLIKRNIEDTDIKINYKILAFKAPRQSAHQYGAVIDLLSQIGYPVKDILLESKLSFEVGLIKTTLIKNGTQDYYVESLLSLLNSILAEGEWNWQSSKININQSFQEAYQIVRRIVLDLPFRINDDQTVFLALSHQNTQNSANLFKFLKGPADQLLGSFKFIWGSHDNKESLICAQNFFKANFEIQYQIFLLPSILDKKKASHNSARFRDILDYNGYTLFMEDISNVDRYKFQKVFSYFSSNKINYILGQQILSQKIKRVGIKLAARVGPSRLIVPFDPAPDFVSVGQQSDIQKAMLTLYPEFSFSQRCVIVIRPFTINANFEQIIVNLLRINNFVVIKRVKVKLNEPEARYMATLQKIAKDRTDAYIQLMTSGVCEIVLVSKRSAIYEAFALCNGCLTGQTAIPSKMFREAPTVELKKGRDTYEYEFGSSSSFANNPLIFNSIKETIGIQTVLFGKNPCPQFMTNIKSGQIVKSNIENGGQRLKMPQKMKDSLLKYLRKDPFNYWMFTSKSQTITEELAGIFLPQCTLFQPVIVVVKPNFVHLVPALRKLLLQHKYHIIREKQILMDKITAAQFVLSCQKIMLPKQTLKLIIEKYSTAPVHIFCLSKISGHKEIISMLADFSFFNEQQSNLISAQFIKDSALPQILIPVWSNQQLILRLISDPLGNIEQSLKSLEQSPQSGNRTLSKSEKFSLFDYLVGSFFGVSINDVDLNTKIGKLSYYIADQSVPRQQSWYYSLISQSFPNYVPLLFQYRQLGQTFLCMQTDKGFPFLDKIMEMYNNEQQKMDKKQLQSSKKDRRSLVLYLWAKKMTEFILDLSTVTTQLTGFGQIRSKNDEYQGNLFPEVAISHQKTFLKQIYEQQQDSTNIAQNIKKLLNSRHLRQRYIQGNKRLIPNFSIQGIREGLRIVEKTETTKLNLVDKFSFIDPQNQKQDLKDMFSFNLYNITPEMKTKYSLAAQIYYFFIREQFENIEISKPVSELRQMLTDLLIQINDLDILEYEIYLRYLIQFSHAPMGSDLKSWLFNLIQKYPNLKKSQKIDYDDAAGKKRKFLDHKQYFVRKNEVNQEVNKRIQKEYLNFDLNTLNQPMKPNVLYDPNDPMHERFANIQNRTNLIRQGQGLGPKRGGIYVQFEKNISEKEELLKEKIKKEVQKFNIHKKDEILHETGLQKDLWYRKVRGEPRQDHYSKVNKAIQKQITKFIAFKEEEQKRISDKKID